MPTRHRLARLQGEIEALRTIVNRQAEDAGLWFNAEYASESYLQNALRVLHAAIESGAATPGIDALKLNDARYRHLRTKANRKLLKNKHYEGDIQVIQWADRTEANVLWSDALDAAIDAAMLREAGRA